MFSGFALMMNAVQAGGGHQHVALPKVEGPAPWSAPARGDPMMKLVALI